MRADERTQAPDATTSPPEPGRSGGTRSSGTLRVVVIAAAIGLAIGGVGAFVIWHHRPVDAVCRAIGCTHLTPTVAPGFTLTDQRGRTVSLGAFRGKAVVLTFMDPRCSDICPIVSGEFVQADRALGSNASGVVFVGVNVNADHGAVGDVRTFTAQHGMAGLRNWYFLTGSSLDLQTVWSRYGIDVQPKPDGSIVHSSIVYFVDGAGRIQFTAFPENAPSAVPTWGAAIAATVRQLESSS